MIDVCVFKWKEVRKGGKNRPALPLYVRTTPLSDYFFFDGDPSFVRAAPSAYLHRRRRRRGIPRESGLGRTALV